MLLAFNNFYVASLRGFLCVPIFKTLLNVPFCDATCFSYHILYAPCIYLSVYVERLIRLQVLHLIYERVWF